MGEEMWHSSNKLDRSIIAFHVSARRLAALTQSGDQARSGLLSAGGEDWVEYFYKVGLLQ